MQAILYLAKWLSIGCIIGILTGTSSAALLASLDWATDWRESHQWMLLMLPFAGLLSGLIYHYWGKNVEAGNNLLLEEIHDPRTVIPLRMAPLVLLGTTISHLFGASVGREGTAVQMGASLADALSERLRQRLTHMFRLHGKDRRIVLMAGISGGFASVFGTPLAGMLFGLEVLAFGKVHYDGLFPCAIAAIVGDRITLAWGLHHQVYQIQIVPALTIWGLLTAIVAGAIFGLTARLFATLTHQISAYFKAKISYPPLRPFIGGILVSIAIQVIGTTKYIGVGIPSIVSAFHTQLPPWDFAAKIGFTALSLGSGFKGGEVTPLFYIGATLGNAIAPLTILPAPLLAGMGFVAVFAGAANTPLTSTLMAIELFGSPTGSYAGIACIVSYLCSGHAGIYRSQRVGLSKYTALKHHEGKSISAIDIDSSANPNSKCPGDIS
ncbi:voltage-gated chloride channel family protein [Chamaesiphon sp. VAR_48_metabat_135_sub]|uniref:voltage-gated chloride channel family protein n=1 Tax=Chamaesiphon sp. VAR_48_metabat_135_sub TaxID=2964699 RepID=UPI00286C6174|nr:voltage-gated chloride channel family protein [Chamaesiphon sp. VAR_48_metabat_135_sub]